MNNEITFKDPAEVTCDNFIRLFQTTFQFFEPIFFDSEVPEVRTS